MKILDRDGTMYHVNDIDRFFASVDLDSMLVIFESTYLSNQIHLAADKVVDAVYKESGEEVPDKYPAEEIAESLESIKRYLLEKDQELEVQDIVDRIENYVIDVLKLKERKSE